jgi:2-aminoadipate transaminase
MDFERLLADRTEKMGVNAIREILKVVSQPGMVSLAGGIPAPESFPIDIIRELTSIVFEKYSSRALQYDPTEGFYPLREALADYLQKKEVHAEADEVLIASGSQGVLDAIGMVLISKGDRIAVEAPTYLGALQAFNPYEPEYIRLDTDDDGLVPASLENILRSTDIKLIYLVPTFQNPTGRTINVERRMEIAAMIKKHDALLIEDDPYSALRYRGEDLPPIKTMAPDNVVYVSTLSKVFAPGLRIGFCVAPAVIRKWLVVVKQGIDLHTSTLRKRIFPILLIYTDPNRKRCCLPWKAIFRIALNGRNRKAECFSGPRDPQALMWRRSTGRPLSAKPPLCRANFFIPTRTKDWKPCASTIPWPMRPPSKKP